MMREILFRGKRMDGKGWMYGYYSSNPTNIHWIRTPRTTYWDEDMVDPSTVGQYTGLSDKNGKRIFECDIVVFKTTVHTFYPGLVIWNDKLARFVVKTNDFEYPMDKSFEYEVIGNINDTPELLKGGNQ